MFATTMTLTLALVLSGEIRPVSEESSQEQQEVATQLDLTVEQTFAGSDTGLKAPMRMRITNEKTWKRIWQKHLDGKPQVDINGNVRGRDPNALPEVNFAKSMIIALVEPVDKFPNGISIDQIELKKVSPKAGQTSALIQISYHSPGKGERLTSGAETNAYGFFVVSRSVVPIALRMKTNRGWKQVKHFKALDSEVDVDIILSQDPDSDSQALGGPRSISLRENGAHELGLPPQNTTTPAERRSINIAFAYNPLKGNYDGVVGSPDDQWNFVHVGTTAIDYMRFADTTPSSARMRISRHDGEWAIKTDNQVMRGYIYHNCQCVDLEATLLDVAPGRYKAYIYAHGDAADQNANIELIVGQENIGKKATSKEDSLAFRSAKLTEGVQYVCFELEVEPGNDIRIISHRDGSGYSMFNAIQLVPVTVENSPIALPTDSPKKQRSIGRQ